jgi:hypothetical protein
MKKISIVMIAAILAFGLPLAAGPSGAEEIKAVSFEGSGVLVEGWRWLADVSHAHSVEWRFDRIPQAQDITVRLEAVARSYNKLAAGVPAEFFLTYGAVTPGAAEPSIFGRIKVSLPNVPGAADPANVLCRGEVVIPRKDLKGSQTLLLRASRNDAAGEYPPIDLVVGFKAESAVLIEKASSQPIFKPKELPPPGPKSQPGSPIDPRAPVVPKPEPQLRLFEGEHLPESDTREDAYLLRPGSYYGDLGAEREKGVHDNVDWFAVNVRKGEIVRVTLDVKEGRNFNLALIAPNGNPLEASARRLDVVDMVDWASPLDGPVFIKINRAAGQGRYALGIDIRHQDDAKSGRDAGADQDGAVPIYPAAEPADGQLLADDNIDFYSIGLEKGWELRVKLLVQHGQNFNLALLRPDGTILEASREGAGESDQFTFKAEAARTFYIRVIRKSGEGHYKLQLSIYK